MKNLSSASRSLEEHDLAHCRRERSVFRAFTTMPALLLLGALWLLFQDGSGLRIAGALLLFASLVVTAFLVWVHRLISAHAVERDQAKAALKTSQRALQGKTAELEQYASELDARVSEKTAHLEQINRDLQHFMYVAGHDLQEPIRMILSYVGLIEKAFEGKLDETTEKYLMFASQGAKRMQVLVGDIVSYSRTCSERIAVNTEHLATPLNQARYSLLVSIRESGAEISVGPLPEVQIDDSKMSLVFQNLLSNAIKFRKPGEPPRIHIEAHKLGSPDENDPEWQISVRDEGIGFEDKYAEKIFGAFQRLHSSSTYPGSGIGLALCKRIIEGHGGRIWAESGPDKGATFFFTLPARAPVRSEAASVSQHSF